MGARIHFSEELSQWISHNLARGCARGLLTEGMVRQGFAPDVADALVGAFEVAAARGEARPQGSIVVDTPAAQADMQAGLQGLASGYRIDADGRTVDVLMRLQRPALALLGGVLAPEECTELIARARSRLRPSTVVDPLTGKDKVVAHRGSEGMFFGLAEDDFIASIDARVSTLMGLPVAHGEPLQVLRYGPGGASAPHFDFLVPQNDANRASLARSGQRVSTLLVYLNDVEAGGATAFPEAGLALAPRRGNGVYFEYADGAGALDHASLHAGEPVLAGEKWVVTKWMRARPFIAA